MERLKKMYKHIILRHQHDAIKINFDILKYVISDHINTENRLLDERKRNIHNDISDTIKEHKQRHKEILNKLIVIEKELYDHIHIHKL